MKNKLTWHWLISSSGTTEAGTTGLDPTMTPVPLPLLPPTVLTTLPRGLGVDLVEGNPDELTGWLLLRAAAPLAIAPQRLKIWSKYIYKLIMNEWLFFLIHTELCKSIGKNPPVHYRIFNKFCYLYIYIYTCIPWVTLVNFVINIALWSNSFPVLNISGKTSVN